MHFAFSTSSALSVHVSSFDSQQPALSVSKKVLSNVVPTVVLIDISGNFRSSSGRKSVWKLLNLDVYACHITQTLESVRTELTSILVRLHPPHLALRSLII